MASPMPIPPMSSYNSQGHTMAAQPEQSEPGMQVRPMSLKVHYTFDREAKVNCLARYPQTLHVHTVPIDETTTIGVVDLRFCVQAITDCSPELSTSQDIDYTIYATDYSEPDTPLVGQGMLSWTMELMKGEPTNQDQPPKMVTGRVTKNLLGVFGGNREILEVRLKLSASARGPPRYEAPRPETSQSQQQQQPQQQQQQQQQQPPQPVTQPQPQPTRKLPAQQPEPEMLPAAGAEWNSFIMSNPQIGQPVTDSRGASPALSQGRPPMVQERRSSFVQAPQPTLPQQEPQRVAPTPVDSTATANNNNTGTSSRPSSRTSNRPPRRKPPTGRPRGRPRKKPAEGNTSGYEDGTEGEDGPAKKRAKTVQVDKASNPFAPEHESLRVAASTSGSLRDFRPVRMSSENIAGRQVQEIPRAPTPVPDGSGSGLPGRGQKGSNLRRTSMMNREMSANQTAPAEMQRALSPSQEDGRSPESVAPTPSYSDDSPGDIGSSPPVPRAASYLQSSPPPSSPILPPMPQAEPSQDGSVANDEFEDLFGEEPVRPPQEVKAPSQAPVRKRGPKRPSSTIPMQVFRMEDGPHGQDMVHLRSYNTPDPSSTPAAPLEPLQQVPRPQPVRPQPTKKQQASNKAPRKPSPKLAMTPPPTTDAPSKPSTPMLAPAVEGLPEPAPTSANASTLEALPDALELPLDNNSIITTEATQSTGLPPPIARPGTAATSRACSEEQPAANKQPQPSATSTQGTTKKPRKLVRSQSAGPLALPTIPASEPAGPSSLSQSVTAGADTSLSAPAGLRRAASSGPLILPMPASDLPGLPSTTLHLPQPAASDMACPPSDVVLPPPRDTPGLSASALHLPQPAATDMTCPPSDAFPPPSSPQSKSNKNSVKKFAIKQRLEEAIMNGQMPPYCRNCGAIETPTWRKVWTQDFDGVPDHIEFSSKPGKVTAMEILKRDEEQRPTSYRLVKKGLAKDDDKSLWKEFLLCNPCGIWLAKCNSHRPQDRWDKDASRLGQERRKRGSGPSNGPRPKKRSKSDSQFNPTSEAYLATDALGPIEPSSPTAADAPTVGFGELNEDSQVMTQRPESQGADEFGVGFNRSNPGSSRSKASSAAKSPEQAEFDQAMGTTKRLLFPSPRKDGTPKVLEEVDINVVHVRSECRGEKDIEVEKENVSIPHPDSGAQNEQNEELEGLFGTPAPARPSTPPLNAKAGPPSGPFKTPSRPTPSHRPVTRSVSASVRSARFVSPGQQMLQRTPTRTPRGVLSVQRAMSGVRRSPRHMQSEIDFNSSFFDTPISRAVNQMLSEPNFGLGDDLDLSSLPALEDGGGILDYGGILSTDAPLPSSPPRGAVSFDYHNTTNMWEHWAMPQEE